MNERDDEFFAHIVARLDDMQAVPTRVLSRLVTRDGACMWLAVRPDEPEWTGNDVTDREAAEHICAGCPVRDACLELEFRTAGVATLGVWGALAEDDRRAAYVAWSQRGQEQHDGGQR
ncbi:MAG TPA: WhiB family transcriptional regulator [Pseudonocardiaceae bacterium]|jgi:WhiB family redox-sensing transcriptional regulator|nr:WhiB family transcriptional regulator [Pseudonocardiaceae bacterium]